jgi:hypothetical protein
VEGLQVKDFKPLPKLQLLFRNRCAGLSRRIGIRDKALKLKSEPQALRRFITPAASFSLKPFLKRLAFLIKLFLKKFAFKSL